MKRILEIGFSLIVFMALCTMIANKTGANLYLVIGLMLLAAVYTAVKNVVYPKQNQDVCAAVQREVWVDYIVKRFFKNNMFLNSWWNDDQYVIGGKTVHIPQPGAKPAVVKNPTEFPLVAVQRTDTEVSYDLDLYATIPFHILNAEEQEISYDKQDSAMGEQVSVMADRAADELIISVSNAMPATNVLYTTGGPQGTFTDQLSQGQTGSRYVLHWKDFKRAQTAFNNQNVPLGGWCALITANGLQQLTDSMTDAATAIFMQSFDPISGRVGRLFDFDVYVRSNVATAASGLIANPLSVNAYGAGVQPTDNDVCLFYHKDAVARAMGETQVFENEQDALYLGNVFTVSQRFGGRRRKADNTGILALVQGTPA